MKKSFNFKEEKNFSAASFDVLNLNEMLQIRGGDGDVKPATRDKDLFGDEDSSN